MRYLILLVPLALVGCGTLDWFTGADEPASFVDADSDGVPDTSPAGRIIDAVGGSGLPYSEAGAALLAFLAGRYIGKRRKEGAA